ncbi:MAG: choice-of-anchor D domain-containing protein [Acidobacteriaceae bacterium]|nr:choice-of-anchor D domain-containing protein [Acidobacteriaceae bacterium]
MSRRVSSALLLSVATLWSHAQGSSTCTGLCLQQVTCPAGQTTSISGKVYAPNGTDPLPNVTVYIPNAPVDPFPAGVSCPVVGAAPSGSPLVGTVSDVDGSFTLTNVPVGANIPVVIVSGRWRRKLNVPGTTACADTSFDASMPKDQTEGEIPKIAIVTGSADSVECVLRKVGIKDSEFTDPSGAGRINFYPSSRYPGARTSTQTKDETALDVSSSTLNAYDVLMLPCEGSSNNVRTPAQLAAFQNFVNSGGRVYASHYSYLWMYQNPPFDSVVNWKPNHYAQLISGTATVNQTLGEGQTLAQWLQLVGATTALGQMNISTLRIDLTTVNPPTKAWLTLNNAAAGNQAMQVTFDTPIGGSNQCGRVLFDEYHVEDPGTISNQNVIFPNECSNTPMSPQEKLLEYSLFSLTSDGGAPTLDPSSYDFGNEPVGFSSATKYFTWTNHSSFNSSVTSATVTGDFAANPINCTNIASGASCQIAVTFTPTVLGAATGTLSVKSSGKALTATLTGTGTPGLTSTPTSLTFGSLDVGASTTKAITITNVASGAIATPPFTVSGDYAATSNCGASIPAGASCLVTITFRPTGTGSRTGTWASGSTAPVYSGLTAALSGTGVDFTLALAPTSGSTVAGIDISTVATVTPIAGFANPVTLSCTDSVTGSTCSSSKATFIPTASTTAQLTIATTSQYKVIGYGLGGGRYLWLVGLGSGLLLLVCRRRAGQIVRVSLMLAILATLGVGASGCGGKAPAQNTSYTGSGDYTYTVTVTDGFLTHTATYSLHVTAK